MKKKYNINIIEDIHKKILIDDFTNGLDGKYWNIVEMGNNYNNELQYYTKDNVFINNGILELEAREEIYNNHKYTSAMITTKNKFEFLYGKVIFKVKAAGAKGVVSAIWLLPADDSNMPEIDIIEVLGSENKQIWTGIHYIDDDLNKDKIFVDYVTDTDFTVYEMEWNEWEIKVYENGKLRFHITENIPDKKMYLVINLAVGGNWARDVDNSTLPAKLLVDYVMIIPKTSGV